MSKNSLPQNRSIWSQKNSIVQNGQKIQNSVHHLSQSSQILPSDTVVKRENHVSGDTTGSDVFEPEARNAAEALLTLQKNITSNSSTEMVKIDRIHPVDTTKRPLIKSA